jgi:hypothetical protein
MTRRTRGLAALAVSVLAAGGTAGWAVTRTDNSAADEPAPAAETRPTTPITKQDLTETTEVDGTLGYGDAEKLGTALQGTVTWLPAVGSVLTRGETLVKVDQQPVTLLYGAVPMYRTLSSGTEGTDVQQLEQNLRALGYTGFTVDDEFTDNTAEAVQEWQEDLGREETGAVKVGEVVFRPSGIRVASHTADLGGSTNGGILTYTGTNRLITVPLPVDDQRMAKKGAKVTVELPGGGTATGTIESVSTVAEVEESSSSGSAPAGNDADTEATIDLTVTLDKPSAAGSFDEAPVTVHLVSEQRKGVLTVPVAALLALKEGGYGLEVVANGNTKIVAVQVGMFAGGRVEVKGNGISAGTQVGVPQT